MYRDITGNPREPLKLFDEMTDKFSYKKLSSVISFLLHSLGSDLKAKGPSIDRAELARLIAETRSLQGMMGIFRFFQMRSRLMLRQFQSYQIPVPSKLTFEMLAKMFIKLLAERYVNPEKILQTAKFLGIDEEEAAQIIVYSQMHDALKQSSPSYFRNLQHREELTKVFVELLEKIDKSLEEKKQKNKPKKKKKEDQQ
jgi:type III secretion protein W